MGRMVAVVALRPLARVQLGVPEGTESVPSLRRWTRRYSSQRDEFYLILMRLP